MAMATGTSAPPPTACRIRAPISHSNTFRDRDEHGADGKNAQRQDIDAAVTVGVRDAPDERHREGVAEQIPDDDPGRLVKVRDGQADCVHHAGQRPIDDRLVQRRHKDAQADDRHNDGGRGPVRQTVSDVQ